MTPLALRHGMVAIGRRILYYFHALLPVETIDSAVFALDVRCSLPVPCALDFSSRLMNPRVADRGVAAASVCEEELQRSARDYRTLRKINSRKQRSA